VILGTVTKRRCPKCGRLGMRIKRSCCVERRQGIKARLKCPRCGYKEVVR